MNKIASGMTYLVYSANPVNSPPVFRDERPTLVIAPAATDLFR